MHPQCQCSNAHSINFNTHAHKMQDLNKCFLSRSLTHGLPLFSSLMWKEESDVALPLSTHEKLYAM